MTGKNYILTKEAAAQKMQRLSLEIAERLYNSNNELILVGIKNSGLVIAEKIGSLLKKSIKKEVTIISASLNKQMPDEVTLSKEADFNNKDIIICDDVANSGRTLLYVLKPLLAYQPKSIQVLVLVERMHKSFPIKPDYVGLSIATTLQDHITVEIEEDEVVGAYIS